MDVRLARTERSGDHSDIGVTLNTYTHLGLEDAKQEMGRVMKEMDKNAKKTGKNGGKIVNF